MEVFALKFPKQLRLTDDEFYTFCQENSDLRLEKTKYGEIIIMPPTGGVTGDKNGDIVAGYDKTLSGEDVLPEFTLDLRWLLD